ncbi:hypothetical protein DSO57_1030127 [Entomophthora muscae]|uniref:Uncharacterized protein n=1 Tax=Entomophthora muscae TaxID=34485 RepID=A0ACC2UL42_9FUNG|nr:hypothetical protein DSO57_1030127 [Entomophthora muscae]
MQRAPPHADSTVQRPTARNSSGIRSHSIDPDHFPCNSCTRIRQFPLSRKIIPTPSNPPGNLRPSPIRHGLLSQQINAHSTPTASEQSSGKAETRTVELVRDLPLKTKPTDLVATDVCRCLLSHANPTGP